MPTQFNNEILAQALAGMRAAQNQETLLRAVQALLDTKVLAPAKWDKEPTRNEDGSMNFDPDTRVSLMVVAGNDGSKYFPMFTSMEEVRNFYGKNPINCLILSIDQYLPFLQAAKEEPASADTQAEEAKAEGEDKPVSRGIRGIVVDPAGADVPFETKFLEGVRQAYKRPLQQNTIQKGDKIWLKNPENGAAKDAMEAALISGGFHEPKVKAIYLKERMENPEKPEETHWFVVIDSDELDTGIFARIGELCRAAANGREVEFIFTNQGVAQKVAQSSKPIYTRAV